MNTIIQNNQNSFSRNHYSHSNKAKKIATGVASAAIPGLGQVINGETSKGITFWLGSLCNYLLFLKNKKSLPLGSIGRIGIGIWSAKDAYDKA